MKKLFNLLIVSLLMFTVTSCARIDSANIGLKVDQFASDTKGEPVVLPVQGMIFYNPFTSDIHEWSGFVKHKVWTKDDTEDSPGNEEISITAADGGRFQLDAGINLQIDRQEAAKVFKKYRIDLDELINTRIRNIVRQCLVDKASNYRSDSLIQYKAKYELAVTQELTARLDSEGFILNNFVILDLRAPEAYSNAINAKIQIQQKTLQAEANLKTVQANANAKVAEAEGYARSLLVQSEAEARSQQLLKQALTPELLRKMWIEKWDGKLPSTTTGENAGLLISR